MLRCRTSQQLPAPNTVAVRRQHGVEEDAQPPAAAVLHAVRATHDTDDDDQHSIRRLGFLELLFRLFHIIRVGLTRQVSVRVMTCISSIYKRI